MAEVSKCQLDVNVKDGSGQTLLHKVVIKDNQHRDSKLRVEEKDVNNFKLLLKFHPDINIIKALTSEGDNILHLAIKNERSLEMVKLIAKTFLDHCVDIDIVDGKGFTALYYAVWPLSFNYPPGQPLPNYSDFKFKFTDAAIVQHLVEKRSRIDMVDKNGYSALLLSVVMRKNAYVQILLQNKDKLSERALEKTVSTCFGQKYCYSYNTLVQYPPVEYYGMTSLQIAVYDNNKEMAQMLISAGANVNAVNGNASGKSNYHQMTPLHISVSNSNFKMAELLVNAGSDITAVRHGENLLHIIIKRKSDLYKNEATEEETQIAKLLIDSGIDYAPLLQAALDHNKQDIVTYMLEKGLDTL